MVKVDDELKLACTGPCNQSFTFCIFNRNHGSGAVTLESMLVTVTPGWCFDENGDDIYNVTVTQTLSITEGHSGALVYCGMECNYYCPLMTPEIFYVLPPPEPTSTTKLSKCCSLTVGIMCMVTACMHTPL